MYVKPARKVDRSLQCYLYVCMYVKPPEGLIVLYNVTCMSVCIQSQQERLIVLYNVTCMSVCMYVCKARKRGWSFFTMLFVCLYVCKASKRGWSSFTMLFVCRYVCMQSGQSGWSSFTVLLPAHRAPMKWQNLMSTASTFSSRGGDQTYNQQTNAGQVPTVPSVSRLYPPPLSCAINVPSLATNRTA